jgi:hypothetical protein
MRHKSLTIIIKWLLLQPHRRTLPRAQQTSTSSPWQAYPVFIIPDGPGREEPLLQLPTARHHPLVLLLQLAHSRLGAQLNERNSTLATIRRCGPCSLEKVMYL